MAELSQQARGLRLTRPSISLGARREEALFAYLFISPALLFFLVFIAAPTLAAVAISLLKWNILGTPSFVGLANFGRLLQDDTLKTVLANTVVFTFWSIVLHIGFGLLLALGVNRQMPEPLRYLLRTAYFFPQLVSWAAVALLWRYILDPNFGLVNFYLGSLHIPGPTWLTSPQLAMPALIVVDLWRTLGFIFIVLLAGLQSVPRDLQEAATLDGAGVFRRFWHVTLPMLSPSLFFAVVINFIGAFQIFEPMYIMTSGGPGTSTESVVMLVYETAFRSFDMGYGSAIAILILAVIMVATLTQVRFSRYWVQYET
jgi:ABC-type sugar transport system permease subunit